MTVVGVVTVFFGEDFSDNNGVCIDPIDDSPGLVRIHDSQLMAAATDDRHRS